MQLHLSQRGFTLVEMIVALAVFSVVVTISIGALLALVAANEQLQDERTVMTNLSFALDSMTREIRTGTGYFCETSNSFSARHSGAIDNMFNNGTNMDSEIGDRTRDCANGRPSTNSRLQGVSFKESGDSITGNADRIVYFFDEDTGEIYRRISGGSAQSIVSSDISITNAEFFVTGSNPLSVGSSELDQPAVTIFIEAREANDVTAKLHRIQTTVVQRTLDI